MKTEMEVRYVFVKETKNNVRYEPEDKSQLMGAIYIDKDALKDHDHWPKSLKVTITIEGKE